MEAADQAREACRYDGRRDLHPHRIDTDGARRIFALAHCDEVVAKARMTNRMADAEHHHQEAERDQKIGPLLAEDHPLEADLQRHVQSACAVCPGFFVIDEQPCDFEERDRRQREERPAQAQRRIRDHQRDERRHADAREHPHPWRDTEVQHQESGGVAADSVVHGVPERQLPREATDDVPRRSQRGENAHLDCEVHDERRLRCQRQDEQRGECEIRDVSAWIQWVGNHVFYPLTRSHGPGRTDRSVARSGSRGR